MSRELPTLQDARDALALADSAANAPWADGVSVEVDSDYLRAALAAVNELTRERDELRAALAEAVAFERAAVVAYLRSSCNDADHDDWWCPTCNRMDGYTNNIAAGRHLRSTNPEKPK